MSHKKQAPPVVVAVLSHVRDASHDKGIRQQLDVLAENHPVKVLPLVLPGEQVAERLDADVKAADVVVLLVSASALADGTIRDSVRERYERGGLTVVFVLVSACAWEDDALLSRLTPIPHGSTVARMARDGVVDDVYFDVARKVRDVVLGRRGEGGLCFGAAHCSYFDLHLCLDPVVGRGARLRPELAFLADREAYNRLYAAGAPVETPRFVLRPLLKGRELEEDRGDRARRGSAFWKRLAAVALPGLDQAATPWDRLLPFVCQPKDLSMRLRFYDSTARRTRAAEVHPMVLLWPFGWSSRLDFDIKGRLALRDVSALAVAVAGKQATPFYIGDRALLLSGVFAELATRLAGDLHGGDGALREEKRIHAASVVSVLEPWGGARATYSYEEPREDLGEIRLKSYERAQIQSIVRGNPVDEGALGAIEEEHGYQVVGLKDRCFALLHRDRNARHARGTFLYLANYPDGDGAPRLRSRRCAASNVRASAQVAAALAGFRADVEPYLREAKTPPGARELADAAGYLLSRWPYGAFPTSVALAEKDGG